MTQVRDVKVNTHKIVGHSFFYNCIWGGRDRQKCLAMFWDKAWHSSFTFYFAHVQITDISIMLISGTGILFSRLCLIMGEIWWEESWQAEECCTNSWGKPELVEPGLEKGNVVLVSGQYLSKSNNSSPTSPYSFIYMADNTSDNSQLLRSSPTKSLCSATQMFPHFAAATRAFVSPLVILLGVSHLVQHRSHSGVP